MPGFNLRKHSSMDQISEFSSSGISGLHLTGDFKKK